VKVILFGATGMVGQGVLRECLLDPDVEISSPLFARPARRSTPNLAKSYTRTFPISLLLRRGFQAMTHVFLSRCLGSGMKEEEYRRLTFDLTVDRANALQAKNSQGADADAARVRARWNMTVRTVKKSMSAIVSR
jgi:hypothetical protein